MVYKQELRAGGASLLYLRETPHNRWRNGALANGPCTIVLDNNTNSVDEVVFFQYPSVHPYTMYCVNTYTYDVPISAKPTS